MSIRAQLVPGLPWTPQLVNSVAPADDQLLGGRFGQRPCGERDGCRWGTVCSRLESCRVGVRMVETVEIRKSLGLADYSEIVHLSEAVRSLRSVAATLLPRLRGRRVWMLNSSSSGGGVAEMLPQVVALMRELGVPTEWVVIGSSRPEFFSLTKRLHNLIHGHGEPRLTADDRALYEAVSKENADSLRGQIGPDDILIVHDPQPLGAGAILKRELGIPAIFRCHIGLDETLPATRAAWDFLQPFAEVYDYSIFSALEYIPEFLAQHSGIIYPAIDPLGHKNRELTAHKLVGILCNARLAISHQPVVPPSFPDRARRLGPDGHFASADHWGEIGLLYRPIVTQVSRWDRLKGFEPLLHSFVRLKGLLDAKDLQMSERHRRRLELVRLVLAGPDPASIQDDPEALEVLADLTQVYRGLSPAQQEDIALISLPMGSLKNNALMVNALQRCSSVVVQNSLREGFGLTVTEAMWKRTAVLGSRACGIRHQIRDGVDGRLVADPEDIEELARELNDLLADVPRRQRYGGSAQRRVHSEFLVFSQVQRWLEVLAGHAG